MKAMCEDAQQDTLAGRWKDFLTKEGYRPSVVVNDENPHHVSVQFKADGRRISVLVDEQDPTFLHVDLSYVLEEGRGHARLLEIANSLNTSLKVVKVTVEQRDKVAHFAVEVLGETLPSGEVLERLLSLMRSAADQFLERVEMEPPRALA
jgi:hypothetical protein